MRQFFEAYQGAEIVSPLVRRLPWTHHLIIMGQSKRAEERESYIRLAVREQWSKRELERQFRASLFERAVLNPPKTSAALIQAHPAAPDLFKDPDWHFKFKMPWIASPRHAVKNVTASSQGGASRSQFVNKWGLNRAGISRSLTKIIEFI